MCDTACHETDPGKTHKWENWWSTLNIRSWCCAAPSPSQWAELPLNNLYHFDRTNPPPSERCRRVVIGPNYSTPIAFMTWAVNCSMAFNKASIKYLIFVARTDGQYVRTSDAAYTWPLAAKSQIARDVNHYQEKPWPNSVQWNKNLNLLQMMPNIESMRVWR